MSRTYIRTDGTVGERSWWSLSIIPDFFWGTVDLIGTFVKTLIFPETATKIVHDAKKRNPNQYVNRGGGRIEGMDRVKGMKDMNLPVAGG